MVSYAKCLILGSALALAACGKPSNSDEAIRAQQGPDGKVAAAGSEEAGDCLIAIWEAREKSGNFGGDAERQFDRDHDKAEGGAISCATGSSATQFEATLKALRDSATNSDRAALLAESGIPLLFINSAGETQELKDALSLEAAFDDVFTEKTIEKLRNIALEKMTVVPNKGGFFDLGALWLVVPETGGRPRLVTVNDQAAAEAAEVAAAVANAVQEDPAN